MGRIRVPYHCLLGPHFGHAQHQGLLSPWDLAWTLNPNPLGFPYTPIIGASGLTLRRGPKCHGGIGSQKFNSGIIQPQPHTLGSRDAV